MLEYGPCGQFGLLTPQANTTVEPEFWIMAPPGVNLITARLVSQAGAMNERLTDYFDRLETTLDQFGNAPLTAVAFACTGSSYLIGAVREAALVERLEARLNAPFVTAARAVAQALRTLTVRRVALVSPYPADLTAASIGYWRGGGVETVKVAHVGAQPGGFHPIYAIDANAVCLAIDEVAGDTDAILLLGTGMPTLGPILERAGRHGVPILSSNLCLGWLTMGRASRATTDRDGLMAWLAGGAWREKFFARAPPADCKDPTLSDTVSPQV